MDKFLSLLYVLTMHVHSLQGILDLSVAKGNAWDLLLKTLAVHQPWKQTNDSVKGKWLSNHPLPTVSLMPALKQNWQLFLNHITPVLLSCSSLKSLVAHCCKTRMRPWYFEHIHHYCGQSSHTGTLDIITCPVMSKQQRHSTFPIWDSEKDSRGLKHRMVVIKERQSIVFYTSFQTQACMGKAL